MNESPKRKRECRFDQPRGNLKCTWGDLTDDDKDRADGDAQRLFGIIQERTGQRQEVVEKRHEAIADGRQQQNG